MMPHVRLPPAVPLAASGVAVGSGHHWCWSPSRGLAPGEGNQPPAARLLVADSWLIADGRVAGLWRHTGRFAASCAQMLPELPCEEVHDFAAAVVRLLPRRGRWFPRMEAWAGSRAALRLWLRPAPLPSAASVLWLPPQPDPRTLPRTKGPDLACLSALREKAAEAGADDALLYAPDGTVLETAHAALVWWRDGTLCLPSPELPVLPSVTVSLLTEFAAQNGTPVRHERVRLSQLSGRQVWAANALHGVRPVTGWRGSHGHPAPRPGAGLTRVPLAEWQRALHARADPLPAPTEVAPLSKPGGYSRGPTPCPG